MKRKSLYLMYFLLASVLLITACSSGEQQSSEAKAADVSDSKEPGGNQSKENKKPQNEKLTNEDIEKAFEHYFNANKEGNWEWVYTSSSEKLRNLLGQTKEEFIKQQEEIIFINNITFNDYLIKNVENVDSSIKKVVLIVKGDNNNGPFTNESTIYYVNENNKWKFDTIGILEVKPYDFYVENEGYYKFENMKQVKTVKGMAFMADITNLSADRFQVGWSMNGSATFKSADSEKEVPLAFRIEPGQVSKNYIIQSDLEDGDLQSITFHDVFFGLGSPTEFSIDLTGENVE
ncbi:hypothetical protein [Mesobacillus jeotgali]|uniref:hypothetical protein n=1 Tax=Mesobacillus jeotgali TaxID=129985 RepID=UPI000C84C7BB|nr:hypothetical protein [Mesobacillus jeotgali]